MAIIRSGWVHGIAAFHFANVTSCDQLVVGPNHTRGGTLELLMTDVPVLVSVAVVPPIGNSLISVGSHFDGSHFDLGFCNKVFLKHQVNWNTVCGAKQDLNWRNIWLADDPVDGLNKHLSLQVG